MRLFLRRWGLLYFQKQENIHSALGELHTIPFRLFGSFGATPTRHCSDRV
jgi:hypothetical protein